MFLHRCSITISSSLSLYFSVALLGRQPFTLFHLLNSFPSMSCYFQCTYLTQVCDMIKKSNDRNRIDRCVSVSVSFSSWTNVVLSRAKIAPTTRLLGNGRGVPPGVPYRTSPAMTLPPGALVVTCGGACAVAWNKRATFLCTVVTCVGFEISGLKISMPPTLLLVFVRSHCLLSSSMPLSFGSFRSGDFFAPCPLFLCLRCTLPCTIRRWHVITTMVGSQESRTRLL